MLWELEVALARSAGRLSRLARRGGGTTLPGKLLSAIEPDALRRLARSLPDGIVLLSATNGKTTTAAMVAEILQGTVPLAHNRSGANLVSGITSALLEAHGARLGLFEVDELAFPPVAAQTRPRTVWLGNLFRDQLDRYGELEQIAERWRTAVDSLPAEATIVVNADDPVLGALGRDRDRVLRFGLDDPAVGHDRLSHAADSKYCVACGSPLDYAVSYVGHLGDYRCPVCDAARAPLDVAAREIDLHGLDGSAFELVTPAGAVRVELALPGLYNVYNAVGAAALATALDASLDEIAEGLARFRPAFGRFERIAAGDRELLILLIKNPAGANEAVRTIVAADTPGVAVVALNDEIADGRDVSWIWDVDFEPLAGCLQHLIATGSRAEELALRFKYGGLDEGRIEVVHELAAALDRGLELTPPGGVLPVLPTYTAMLALRAVAVSRGLVDPYWKPGPGPPAGASSGLHSPGRKGGLKS
ncbi:MAG: MurT ligase domain-containing protein [Gaiellales bacterium]